MAGPKNKTPAEPKPWDIPPILPEGDPTPPALYSAVGTALSAWERLDEVQARLFGVLVNSRLGSAEAAYGMVQSSSGRSDMVAAAARTIFDAEEPLLLEMIGLLGEIGQLAGRRNDIAHGLVSTFITESESGTYLIPARYNTRKRLPKGQAPPEIYGFGFPHKYAYTAAQVSEFTATFHTYRERLSELLTRVTVWCSRKWPQK